MSILTRKIKLEIIGDKEEKDRVWEQLRKGIEAQSKAMNQYMSALYISMISEMSKEDRKELNQLYGRVPSSKKGSAYTNEIEFFKGLPSASHLAMYVRQDFDNAMKKGLTYGRVSLPSYKKDFPLLVHVDYIKLRKLSRKDDGIYHNYESHTEFLEHLNKPDLAIYIKFANNVTFKMILGNPHKSRFLREEIKNIFEENYQVQGSSIQIDGKSIILNLCMNVPKKEVEINPDIKLGVDLGVTNTAVCALNNKEDQPYSSNFIGEGQEFLKQRNKFKMLRKKKQQSIKYMTNGGHGRNKKCIALDNIKRREKNFAKTYNHRVSKEIVDFAVKNHAGIIQLEDLSNYKYNAEKDENKKKLLGVWGYYQLQQDIEYKASGYGIKVKYINSQYTSQTCSFCGKIGERRTRDDFYCINNQCSKYEVKINADWNAARNIAFSEDYSSKNKNNEEELIAV